MTSGISFKPKLEDITEVLTHNNGNISATAKHYKVCREAIYRHIYKFPSIKQLLEDLRTVKDENLLDSAESVIAYCLNLREKNTKLSLDAARYVLDNKGKKRDWGQSKEDSDIRGLVQDKISDEISVLYDQQKKV
jgi:hypothetical protein